MSYSVKGLDFRAADETRQADKARVDVIHTPNGSVAKMVLEPGWTWESSIKPLVGGDSCQVAHLGYVEEGEIHITSDDGTEEFFAPGDVYVLTPGHHAEVTSTTPFIAYEFSHSAAQEYANTAA
jgi:hypothetical protein